MTYRVILCDPTDYLPHNSLNYTNDHLLRHPSLNITRQAPELISPNKRGVSAFPPNLKLRFFKILNSLPYQVRLQVDKHYYKQPEMDVHGKLSEESDREPPGPVIFGSMELFPVL